MNYKYIAALALLGASSLVCADENKPSNFYVEAGYINLNLDVKDVGDKDIDAGMLKLGYSAHENLAIEIMAGTGFSDLKGSAYYDDGSYEKAKVELSSMLGIYLKPKFKLGDAEIFARVGYTRLDWKLKYSYYDGEQSDSESLKGDDGDISFGAGVGYSFTKQVYAQVDYMRYYDKKKNGVSLKIGGPSISIGYRF